MKAADVKTMWNAAVEKCNAMSPRAKACALVGVGLGLIWVGQQTNSQPAVAATQPGFVGAPMFGAAMPGPGAGAYPQQAPGAYRQQMAAGAGAPNRTVIDSPYGAPPTAPSGAALQQGRFFRYALPAGWMVQETQNGVDLMSPDRRTGASVSLVVNYGFTRLTPASFFSQMGPRLAQGLPSFRASGLRPVQDALRQYNVESGEADVSFMTQGGPVVGTLRSSAWNGMGRSMGTIALTYAPESDWPSVRPFLQQLAQSIASTNAGAMAGQNTLIQPQNNPNTAHEGIIASGEYRNRSRDYTGQIQSETTMGAERMQDSQGWEHTVPFSNYDPTIGGYQDPYGPRGEIMTRPPDYQPPAYPRW